MLKFLAGYAVDGFYEREMAAQYSLHYMIIYTLILIAALFVTSFGIRVSLSIRAYHNNVTRLFCIALSAWLLMFISKVCAFLYHIRGNNTSDPTNPGFFFLQVSAFTRYFYFYFGSATPLAATVERGFATLLLSNYEKTSRSSVFILITFVNFSIALLFSILTVFFNLQVIFVVLIPSSYLLICFLLLTFLYQFNLSRFNKLNNYHREVYTLSRKFQLRENIRILSLLMKMIYAVVFFIAIIVAGLSLPVLLNIGYLTGYMRTIGDWGVHCNPLIVIPMTTYFIPEFKRNARASLSKRISLARISVDSHYRSYRQDSSQADVYFDLFKKSIKTQHKSSTDK